jgi:hypothetical protein
MAFRLLYLSSFSKETIVTKINLKRRLWVASVAVVALFLLNACYTDYGLSIEEYDVVATQYDVDYNFTDKGRNTYVLDDTVRHLVREGEEPDRKYDAQLLAKVEAEMAAKGFTKVDYDEDNPAPFAVTISPPIAMSLITTGAAILAGAGGVAVAGTIPPTGVAMSAIPTPQVRLLLQWSTCPVLLMTPRTMLWPSGQVLSMA